MSSLLKSKLFAVVLSASIMGVLCLSLSSKQSVVTFDQGKAISEFAKELTKSKLSENSKALLITKFTKIMQKTLLNEAKTKNVIIVSNKSVLAGSEDITSKLLPQIAAKLKLSLKHGGVSV